MLVSTGKELVKLWDATTGKLLGSQPAKSKNHAPLLKVTAVTSTHVLTAQPLALFELRF